MNKKDVAILDFGSKAITVIIGDRGVNGTFRIKGKGTADYAGFQNGEFLESDEVKMAVGLSIANAETEAGVKISEIYVGVPGEFSNVACKELLISFPKKKKIADSDIKQLLKNGNSFKNNFAFSAINQSPIYFTLDDGRRMIDPRGIASTKLKGFISYILAENNFIDFVQNILSIIGIKNAGFISDCLAETLYLFDPSIRDRYVLLVDVGYITTSVMLGRGDGLLFMKSFSMGGGHISGDLAMCLKIPFPYAESLKRKLIINWKPTENDTYELPTADLVTPISAVATNEIAIDRIDMICTYITKCLEQCEFEFPEYIPLYVTGGGLNYIRGIKDHLAKKLGKRVEFIAPALPNTARPDYSSEIGLLDVAISVNEDNNNLICR